MATAIYNQTLLEGVAESHPMPIDQVKAAAKEVLSLVKEGLLRDGTVRVNNFGTFKLKHVAEHQGRNPKTGESITIKAKNRVVFRPSKALRELIEPNRAKATPVPEPVVEKKIESDARNQSKIQSVASAPTLVSVPMQRDTSEQEPDSSSEHQEIQIKKSNGKIYLAGASAALVLALAVFLLQEDQEVTHQPVVATQPIFIEQTTTITTTTTEINTTWATPQEQQAQDEMLVQEEPLIEEPQILPYFAEQLHRLVRGDSLWKLAGKNFGDPLFWPHIYQANRDTIVDPDRLRENQHIVLPELQGRSDDLTEDDRYHISEGYYLAYLHYKSIGNKDSFFALLEAKRYSPRLVEEKMSTLNLSRVERILLEHQRTL